MAESKFASWMRRKTEEHECSQQRHSRGVWTALPVLSVLPILSLLLVLPILMGCSSCGGKDTLDFQSREDALKVYKDYLVKVRKTDRTNTAGFSTMLREWKELNDTVYRYLAKDSVFTKYHNEAGDYFICHDSIRTEMLRLAETWRYGYGDVLLLKEQTCTYKEDKELLEAVKAAEPFFTSLDSVAISICDKTSILKRYRYFLAEVKNNGINSKDELLDFIRQEDFLFRTFLAHLYEMDKEPLADITKDTEAICRDIFISARNGNIAAKDVVVYMSMRTVRRLLQNSVECVNNINSLEMKTKAQGNAYIWMIIQPFISIDQFSLATMTPLERSKFNYIITNLPKSKRFAQVFDIKQRELNYLLPQQLLKIYVLSL